ncbi:MAG TPA: lysophospholipid acyltransferase family protein [Actinomycetota bacterium]|nr:lysophospholipid acyltransferase family protein [Actinomycetota bacterium]
MSSIEAERKALIAGAAAELDARDPEFIRYQLPGMWLFSTMYFRAEVTGFDRVPDGPVLFVGNHSGGNMTPDSMVFMLAFNTYFGVERPVYALAHSLVTSWPVLGKLAQRWGIVTAGPKAARAALERGASVLVYPGGDVDTHRPWTARHEIRFDGRKGFLRIARDAGVPIVPVVSVGGQDTYLPLTDGRKVAELLRLDKIARLKVLPVSLALPWGLNVGDFLGHVPLPAKIRMDVLEPIDVAERFGDEADSDEAYDYVVSRMQESLTALAAGRLLPPFL